VPDLSFVLHQPTGSEWNHHALIDAKDILIVLLLPSLPSLDLMQFTLLRTPTN
jgi:hypothetical protein